MPDPRPLEVAAGRSAGDGGKAKLLLEQICSAVWWGYDHRRNNPSQQTIKFRFEPTGDMIRRSRSQVQQCGRKNC